MITFCVKPKVFLFIMQNLKQKFVGFLFRQLLCIFFKYFKCTKKS